MNGHDIVGLSCTLRKATQIVYFIFRKNLRGARCRKNVENTVPRVCVKTAKLYLVNTRNWEKRFLVY